MALSLAHELEHVLSQNIRNQGFENMSLGFQANLYWSAPASVRTGLTDQHTYRVTSYSQNGFPRLGFRPPGWWR